MKILVDTREQKPLFPNAKFVTLKVGDYTTEKLKSKFVIERKSLQDLYQTLTRNNTRFKYELFHAAYLRITIEVYVEGSYEDFINKRFTYGDNLKFSTQGLQRLVSTFERKYYLKFVWCSTRKNCVSSVHSRLLSAEKKS